MDKEQILKAIKAQLKSKGLSAAEASERAVGNQYLIANMGRDRYGMPTTESLMALCDVLGLDFYIGLPRDVGAVTVTEVSGVEYARIPVHEAELAAGDGAHNDGETVIDHLAFRRDWLKRIGVSASAACIARVRGDSMQPTVWGGDMILIDTTRKVLSVRHRDPKDQRRPSIYALRDGNETRVKRLERPSDDLVMLVSDNPDYPPELRPLQEITVLGKVAWWGHTVRD